MAKPSESKQALYDKNNTKALQKKLMAFTKARARYYRKSEKMQESIDSLAAFTEGKKAEKGRRVKEKLEQLKENNGKLYDEFLKDSIDLIKQGSFPNVSDKAGEGLLFYLLTYLKNDVNNKAKIARLQECIDMGVNPNARLKDGRLVIDEFLEYPSVVGLLIQNGFNLQENYELSDKKVKTKKTKIKSQIERSNETWFNRFVLKPFRKPLSFEKLVEVPDLEPGKQDWPFMKEMFLYGVSNETIRNFYMPKKEIEIAGNTKKVFVQENIADYVKKKHQKLTLNENGKLLSKIWFERRKGKLLLSVMDGKIITKAEEIGSDNYPNLTKTGNWSKALDQLNSEEKAQGTLDAQAETLKMYLQIGLKVQEMENDSYNLELAVKQKSVEMDQVKLEFVRVEAERQKLETVMSNKEILEEFYGETCQQYENDEVYIQKRAEDISAFAQDIYEIDEAGFDADMAILQESGRVLEEVKDITMLGHKLGLTGKVPLETDKFYLEKIKLEGFNVLHTVPSVYASIEDFKKSAAIQDFLKGKTQPSQKAHEKAFDIVLDVFKTGQEAHTSKGEENRWHNTAIKYAKGLPVMFESRWEGHSAMTIAYKDRLYICNKGIGTAMPSIKVYSIGSPSLLLGEPKEAAKQFQTLSETVRKDTGRAGKITDFFGEPGFADVKMMKPLKLKKVGEYRLKGQKVGNCSYTNTKRSIDAILMALEDRAQLEGVGQKAVGEDGFPKDWVDAWKYKQQDKLGFDASLLERKAFYQTFSVYDRVREVDNYLDKYVPNQEILNTHPNRLDPILQSLRDQHDMRSQKDLAVNKRIVERLHHIGLSNEDIRDKIASLPKRNTFGEYNIGVIFNRWVEMTRLRDSRSAKELFFNVLPGGEQYLRNQFMEEIGMSDSTEKKGVFERVRGLFSKKSKSTELKEQKKPPEPVEIEMDDLSVKASESALAIDLSDVSSLKDLNDKFKDGIPRYMEIKINDKLYGRKKSFEKTLSLIESHMKKATKEEAIEAILLLQNMRKIAEEDYFPVLFIKNLEKAEKKYRSQKRIVEADIEKKVEESLEEQFFVVKRGTELESEPESEPALDLGQDKLKEGGGNDGKEELVDSEEVGVKEQKILDEIYETEKTYCAALESLFSSDFCNAIISEKGVPGVASEKLVLLKNLFLSGKDLISYSKKMLNASEEGAKGYDMIAQIDDSFVEPFAKYVIDYPRCINSLGSLTKTEKDVLDEMLPQALSIKGLDSILITPVQRLPKYVLFSKELLKNVDKKSKNRRGVKVFAKKAEEIAESVNEKKRKFDWACLLEDYKKTPTGEYFVEIVKNCLDNVEATVAFTEKFDLKEEIEKLGSVGRLTVKDYLDGLSAKYDKAPFVETVKLSIVNAIHAKAEDLERSFSKVALKELIAEVVKNEKQLKEEYFSKHPYEDEQETLSINALLDDKVDINHLVSKKLGKKGKDLLEDMIKDLSEKEKSSPILSEIEEQIPGGLKAGIRSTKRGILKQVKREKEQIVKKVKPSPKASAPTIPSGPAPAGVPGGASDVKKDLPAGRRPALGNGLRTKIRKAFSKKHNPSVANAKHQDLDTIFDKLNKQEVKDKHGINELEDHRNDSKVPRLTVKAQREGEDFTKFHITGEPEGVAYRMVKSGLSKESIQKICDIAVETAGDRQEFNVSNAPVEWKETLYEAFNKAIEKARKDDKFTKETLPRVEGYKPPKPSPSHSEGP